MIIWDLLVEKAYELLSIRSGMNGKIARFLTARFITEKVGQKVLCAGFILDLSLQNDVQS
jgi:hypothetical protein